MANEDIKILVVDDDEVNRECAEMNLKRFIGYTNFSSADDGTTCLEHLESNPDVDIIFLDRMMNRLNGIPTLHKMNENAKYKDIVVIFQTGEVSKEDKLECISAGSLYLLQKPYGPEDQGVFVHSIAPFIRAKRRIKEKIDSGTLTGATTFSFRSFDEAENVAAELAAHFPDPDLVYEAIYELLINAIEHGNLRIGYALKTNLLKNNSYFEEIKNRLDLPENKDKLVEVSLEKDGSSIKLVIKDHGGAFIEDGFVEFGADALRKPSGRGIYKAKRVFSSVEYVNNGSEVVCTFLIK